MTLVSGLLSRPPPFVSGHRFLPGSVVVGGRSALRTVTGGVLQTVGVAVGIGVVDDSSGDEDPGAGTGAGPDSEPEGKREKETPVGA